MNQAESKINKTILYSLNSLTRIYNLVVRKFNVLLDTELFQQTFSVCEKEYKKIKPFGLSIILGFIVLVEAGIFMHQNGIDHSAIKAVQSIAKDPVSAGYSLSANLFPEGVMKFVKNIQPQAKKTEAKASVTANNTKANGSTPSTKATPKKQSSVKNSDQDKTIPITISDSMSGRDEDRKIIIQQLADRISKYTVMYNKFPLLYRNKSKSELASENSDSIYLYNGDENKTNALAFTNGAYEFSRINICQDTSTKINEVKIVYSGDTLLSCQEDGHEYMVWIGN